MERAFRDGAAFQKDAKEYARFCRFRGLFLVDGLEPWRKALKERGLSEDQVGAKVSAAIDFVRRMGEPFFRPSGSITTCL